MSAPPIPRPVQIKEQSGWFAAGLGLQRALACLSDGAFKLFAWLCLQARRDSGVIEATQNELARALGKSKRAVGRWAAELAAKGVCQIDAGANQHARTRFRICDSYWPYHRPDTAAPPSRASQSSGDDGYVDQVRDWFVQLPCGKGSFAPADAEFARQLQERGLPLQTLENALLLGAARKYESWLNGRPSAPIASLRYFAPLIQEAEQLPFSPDYRGYLRGKIKQYQAQLLAKDRPPDAAVPVAPDAFAGAQK